MALPRLLLPALLALGALLAPAALGQSPKYAFVSSGDVIEDKSAYLLTLFAKDAAAHAILAHEPALKALTQRSRVTLQTAYDTCKDSTRCIVEAMTMKDADILIIADDLARLAAPGGSLNPLVRAHLRPSGLFQSHAGLSDGDLMRAAFIDTAAGVNRLYRIYASGEAPRYPAIDAMSYSPEDKAFRSLLLSALETALDEFEDYDLFFEAWERVGFDLLLINQRDESARHEPLAKGENRAAFQRAAKLDWSKFTYTAIVVPGAGLGDGEQKLSAAGALRVRLAVRRYRRGLAPFLIVSGGYVHPNKTSWSEAIEMKRELIDKYHVPADAIIIDPHARHTTTNLRNSTRLLFRAGAPMTRPLLVTTSRGQSASIASDDFRKRCEDELGYQPDTLVARLTPNDLVMAPSLFSLEADPRDPLDP